MKDTYKKGVRAPGHTPYAVVKLLSDAVSKSSQSAVARETGLTLLTVQNYLKGIGEPTTATLQKLANYFNETFTIEIRPQKGEGHEDNI